MKRAIKFAAAGMAALMCLAFAGCGAGGENRTYTVTLSEIDTQPQYSSTVEMLEEIRPTVVDVTAYLETGASAGSGVIIGGSKAEGSDAYEKYFIVTNHHVIEDGTSYTVDVLTIDGSTEYTTTYPASLVGSSMKRDIAVLSIAPPADVSLKIASFIADSNTVKVGTEVFAVGNPLGILGGTVTHGIVSATKRAVALDEIGAMTLMQTDTAINGGNSGGGLFDANGNLVGVINSGYETYNGQSVEGLNFAIPANDAKFAAESLIATYRETGGTVTQYGYVEGDARLDISFSTAALYTSSALSARATYLIAAASSAESPLYAEWSNSTKVVTAITVNGEKIDLTSGGSGAYSLTAAANSVIEGVKAGDKITVEYKNVLGRSGGFFGASYYYVDGTARTVTVTAQQYVYEP